MPHFVPLQSCPVEVTPGGMLSLLTDVPQGKVLELKPKAETKVVVKAVRTAEAKFPVTVTLAEAIRVEPISRRPQPPIGVKEVTIPADKDEATITLRAETLAEGTYNVILAGTMNAGKQAVTCVAPAVRVKVFAAAGRSIRTLREKRGHSTFSLDRRGTKPIESVHGKNGKGVGGWSLLPCAQSRQRSRRRCFTRRRTTSPSSI